MSNPPVRVMLVDDSSVVRRLLTAALARHAEVEVVGTAANGVIALSKIPQLSPELLILDIEMPEMDGISLLGALRVQYPRLPVIMFSTLTERGASVTFDALAAGADDYVLKPSTQSGETLDSIVSGILLPKILGLTRSRLGLAIQAALSTFATADAPDTKRFTGLKPSSAGLPTRSLSQRPVAPSNPFAAAADAYAGKYTLKSPGVQAPSAPALTRPRLGGTPPSSPEPTFGRGSLPANPTTGLRELAPRQPATLESGLKPGPVAPKVATGSAPSRTLAVPAKAPRQPAQIIVIAASTGGPNALADIVPRLPAGLSVPVVIVQHMPPIFTRCLADRLSARSELRILESQGGERLTAGHVYIAPGNRHLEVVRDAEGVRTLLSDGPPENSCRPAADVTMRSIARAYGAGTMGVVLTGMGHDGLRGAREICDAGGRVLVQSGSTCVIWGMPKAVEEAGLAEAVVPLAELAAAILHRVGLGLLSVRDPEVRR